MTGASCCSLYSENFDEFANSAGMSCLKLLTSRIESAHYYISTLGVIAATMSKSSDNLKSNTNDRRTANKYINSTEVITDSLLTDK